MIYLTALSYQLVLYHHFAQNDRSTHDCHKTFMPLFLLHLIDLLYFLPVLPFACTLSRFLGVTKTG